ncbi:hypothetical protein MNBD_GAMMA03-1250 [hydrothermal vent metagenome]|uniref:O-antigen ligase-related domain-containing protein n=1 Tax=hydrothermal vent metagenome TaxID=652676 RepID=A0A3B0WQJ9_9ZZZZ
MYLNKNQSGNKRQKFFFTIFCLIILINPLPLGSNRAWAWSFEAMLATGLLIVMVSCSLFSSECISWHRIKQMKTELLLIAAWFFVNILYVIPLPVSLLNFISPNVASAYAGLGLAYGYLSLDVYASYQIFMLSMYYFILFVLGVVLVNSRWRIKFILFLFIFLGVFESIYGMYLVSVGQTGTLVQVTTVSTVNASGTFINKNHLVAFLSMSFILGLALRLILSSKSEDLSHVNLKIRVIQFIGQPMRSLDFCLFLILAGIWSTHSRAGLASFILAILFLYLFLFFSSKIKKYSKKSNKISSTEKKSSHYKAIVLVFALSIVLLIFVADDLNYVLNTLGKNSQDSVAQHIQSSAQGRLLAFNQVVDNFPLYWFSGVGPGAYQVFFVNHRTLEQTAYFDHAHNDYLEFVVEYGLFSLVLLILLLVFLYRIFIFIFKTRSAFYNVLGICVVSSMIYMLLHANMDFNARIPANVVTIIVALSVIYGKIVMSNVNKSNNYR